MKEFTFGYSLKGFELSLSTRGLHNMHRKNTHKHGHIHALKNYAASQIYSICRSWTVITVIKLGTTLHIIAIG